MVELSALWNPRRDFTQAFSAQIQTTIGITVISTRIVSLQKPESLVTVNVSSLESISNNETTLQCIFGMQPKIMYIVRTWAEGQKADP